MLPGGMMNRTIASEIPRRPFRSRMMMMAPKSAMHVFVVILSLSAFASHNTDAFQTIAGSKHGTTMPFAKSSVTGFPLSSDNKDDQDSSVVKDDDNDLITPYGNQTLAWTKKYRRLVPYESARLTAMRLGLRSKEEWDDIREFGKAFHGAHLVSRPQELYRKEWVSWEEFLGVMRPYEDAKQVVTNTLKLESMDEYVAFVKEDVKRAESLRIPAKPEIYYRDKGWTSEEDFFN